MLTVYGKAGAKNGSIRNLTQKLGNHPAQATQGTQHTEDLHTLFTWLHLVCLRTSGTTKRQCLTDCVQGHSPQ